jgi:hypothetical protein
MGSCAHEQEAAGLGTDRQAGARCVFGMAEGLRYKRDLLSPKLQGSLPAIRASGAVQRPQQWRHDLCLDRTAESRLAVKGHDSICTQRAASYWLDRDYSLWRSGCYRAVRSDLLRHRRLSGQGRPRPSRQAAELLENRLQSAVHTEGKAATEINTPPRSSGRQAPAIGAGSPDPQARIIMRCPDLQGFVDVTGCHPFPDPRGASKYYHYLRTVSVKWLVP